MEIPVKNIYYMLLYAWDKLEEKDIVDIDKAGTSKLVDLLALILIKSTSRLLKRGLDKYYIENEDEICGIKGKLNIATTIKANKLLNLKSYCKYDELSYNILHNQILKTTIKRLCRINEIDHQLKGKLHLIERYLPPINEIQIKLKHFRQVQLHKNNHHYEFTINLCRLIFESLILDESTGNYYFRDFIRDKRKMAVLFESFVRNYYKIEHKEFRVKSSEIDWKFEPIDNTAMESIPKMKTDITLLSVTRKIIVDTKYYPKAFASSREGAKEKFISHHLYQLTAYLINQEDKDDLTKKCEGILLYPTAERDFDYKYLFKGHKIRLVTINLNQDWPEIKKQLNDLIKN
jgi:5-methylcytosine-specific restriction enzyme subunit McrC